MIRLKKVAMELGLPLGERKKTYNSRLAQELGKWAETKGKGDRFHDAIFRAYFVDGENIAKTAVLIEIVKALNLPQEEAVEVLKKRTYKEAVDSDWDLACRMEISAVPTFVLNQQTLVGAQPYEVLEQFLMENGVTRKRVS